MDETLDQLGTLLSSKSRRGWIARHPLRAGQFHAECPCGMNPLLAYFSTGSLALHDALAGPARLNHDEQETIRQAWQTLAQREIEPLCSSCQRVSAMEFVPLLLSSGPCMQALAPD